MMLSWTDRCGGGISWKNGAADRKSGPKAAIANSLLLVVSSKLYELSKEQKYLDAAEKVASWFLVAGLVTGSDPDPQGGSAFLVNDHVEQDASCSLQATKWSYNSGVLLGGLAHLSTFGTSNSSSYLALAERLASAGMAHFADSNGVARETQCEGDASCGDDGTQFRGPFVRGLSMLHARNHDPAIRAFITRSLRSALDNDCNGHWQFELHWGGPYNIKATCTTQVPVLDLFAAAYAVNFVHG
jgi:predicted alpha-1,6-mannanase (GH76 family)